MKAPLRIAITATVCLLANIDPAFAGNWSPNNAMVLGSSSSFVLVITPNGRNTPVLFGCTSVAFLATTTMPASNEWTFTPTMLRCKNVTRSWTTAGNWKAVSVRINAGVEAEANLEIPLNGFEFEPTVAAGGENTCKVKARATTIGEAKDYFNENPLAPPSFWTSSVNPNVQNKVKIEAQNALTNPCFTTQTEVPILYAFNLYNLSTGATEGIHVN